MLLCVVYSRGLEIRIIIVNEFKLVHYVMIESLSIAISVEATVS